MTERATLRVGAKALILEGRPILLVEILDDTGLHYNLPSGGTEPGELVREDLRREVLAEPEPLDWGRARRYLEP